MESLEQLKEIIANAPEGADEFFIYQGAVNYIDNHENGHQFKIWCEDEHRWVFSELVDGWQYIKGRRSLSDIERIIELEERLNNSEPKKEECKHLSSTASYTHITCDSCYMVRTDGGWGCASRKWFDNIESAKFYEKNGFLPR